MNSADGEGVIYAANPTGERVKSSPWYGTFMGYRNANGWNSGIPTDPPFPISQRFRAQSTLAISSNWTKALVATPQPLAPGAVAGALNVYIEDIAQGTYRLVLTSQTPGAINTFTGLNAGHNFLAGGPNFEWLMLTSSVPLLPGVETPEIYRWSDDSGLEVESVLPDGSIPVGDSQVAGGGLAVSPDGDRVYFSQGNAITAEPIGVFFREDGKTIPVSVSQLPGAGEEAQPAELAGASADGQIAYIASPDQLTSDAPEPGELEGDWALYRYDLGTRRLTYLGARANGGGAFFNAAALYGATPDGETLYFGDRGAMYTWSNGQVHEIAPAYVINVETHFSPNGRYFAFATDQVYLFDSKTNLTTCLTCSVSGPGQSSLGPNEHSLNATAPEVVNDSGEVVFQTEKRLVQADTNGRRDVYIYQGGTVKLISPGTGAEDATVGGISSSGRDVFFFTAQGLLKQDQDGQIDLYDARRGGGFAESEAAAPPCSGEGCQGTVAAGSEAGAIGSEAAKPVTAKKKTKKRRKAACVKHRHGQANGKKRCRSGKKGKAQKGAGKHRRSHR
jgi:hypothetical protein